MHDTIEAAANNGEDVAERWACIVLFNAHQHWKLVTRPSTPTLDDLEQGETNIR